MFARLFCLLGSGDRCFPPPPPLLFCNARCVTLLIKSTEATSLLPAALLLTWIARYVISFQLPHASFETGFRVVSSNRELPSPPPRWINRDRARSKSFTIDSVYRRNIHGETFADKRFSRFGIGRDPFFISLSLSPIRGGEGGRAACAEMQRETMLFITPNLSATQTA